MYGNKNFSMSALGRGNNGKWIEIGELELFVSYNTVIAFRTPKTGLVARENDWSTTTGGHMSAVPGNSKEDRISGSEFEKRYNEMLESYGLIKADS